MKGLLQKIKSWYEKLRNPGISYQIQGLNPAHDWRLILVTTFVLICLEAFLAFYFYIQIDSGKFFVVTGNSEEKEVKLDQSLLQKTVDDLNLKEANLVKIRADRVSPKEPSI